MVAPMAMPATLSPLMQEISTISATVPSASPPRTGPNQTWNIR